MLCNGCVMVTSHPRYEVCNDYKAITRVASNHYTDYKAITRVASNHYTAITSSGVKQRTVGVLNSGQLGVLNSGQLGVLNSGQLGC